MGGPSTACRRGLLAGHREPGAVSPGELRRPRPARAPRHPGCAPPRQRLPREGVEIDDIERIEGPAYLGNYCRIGADATVGPYSVLSSSVTLRDRARTVASVIDASTHIGRSALIENAIVGRNCDIRSHVRIHEDVAVGDEVRSAPKASSCRADLPLQGGGVGLAGLREPDLRGRSTPQLFGQGAVTGLVNVDLTPDTALKVAAALGTALKRDAAWLRAASRRRPAG